MAGMGWNVAKAKSPVPVHHRIFWLDTPPPL
jgi:hypothetical protein